MEIKQVFTGTYKAAAAILKGQAVKFTANENEVNVTSATTDRVIGIAMEDQAVVGEGVKVMHIGECWAIAAAAIAIGAPVVPTATGGRLDDTALPATLQWMAGHALSAAAANGDHFRLLLMPAPVNNGTS